LADPCPNGLSIAKQLRAKVDKTDKEQLAFWLPYLDSIKTCNQLQDSVKARLYRKIGGLYRNDKDYINALKFYSKFLEITKRNLGRPNFSAVDLAGGYYWLAIMYEGLNMKKEKMMAFDSCIVYAERAKHNDRANLYALYQKVEYFYDLGDYYRSIDCATRCETAALQCQLSDDKILREDGFEYNSSSSAWKVNAFLQLGSLSAAEEYIGRKINESIRNKSNYNLGIFYALLAEANVKKADLPQAISLFQKALKIEQTDGNNFSCKQILNTMGSVVFRDYYHNNQTALKSYEKALAFHNNDPKQELADKIESVNIYTNIAGIYISEKQFDKAFSYFQKAFDQIGPGASEDSILIVRRPGLFQQKKVYYITDLMIAKGEAFQKKYLVTGNKQYLQKALHVFRITDQFLDLLRKEQTELESKLFWRKDTRRLYEKAIDACNALNDVSGAFYYFERSRAALLNDQLTHQRWVNDLDIRKEIQLSKKLIQLQRMLDTSDQSKRVYRDLVNEKLKTSEELEKLRKEISDENPLYYHNMVDTGVITISYANRFLLADHSAILEMFVGDSAVYVLAITGKENRLKKLDRKKYEVLSTTFTSLLSDPGAINQYFDKFQTTARELHAIIFDDLKIPPGRLIISPDGSNFPFEALVISTQPLKYFVEDYAVSYTYSAQFLESTMASNSTNRRRDFFGLAPVQFNPAFRLVSLEGSDESLNRINQLFRSTNMITGKEVSPQKFMDQFYQYQIVQLYTHAADSGINKEPVIYFGDSILSLSDLVYEKRPDTRLMVLSACETASGKFYKGEGVFSFSRGFAALGIPSSISNLWSVENESTYRLTELFYKYLAEGLPLDISLQKAKLEFIKTTSREKQLPYFWAAQILSGRTDAISIQKPIPVTFILTGFVAGLFIIGFSWKWFSRKKSIPTQGKAESVS